MKMFRIMLDDNTDDVDTNYGYRCYYVLANSMSEAIEIISLLESREPDKLLDRQVEVQFCYQGKAKVPTEKIVEGRGTGYFKTINLVDPTMLDGEEYCSIVMPFNPFSVRKHFIDSIIDEI